MSKKKTMSNDQLLSRQVGELVGWKIQYGYDDKITHITNAQGELQCMLQGDESEEDAWDFTTNWWCKYATDVNQALTLTVDGWELQLWERNESAGKWFAQYFNDSNMNVATGWSDHPAEAICKARLALAEHLEWAAKLPNV